jgi:deoxyadenosine/deoxycytidine kinase
MNQGTIVLSLDGNIGAGKSTLLEAIKDAMPEVEVVVEPVGEWLSLKNGEGKSLLELFYEDKRRWAYTFQNCAILTRLRSIKQALATTKKKVVITERSVLTDRYVFAEMLRTSGDIDDLEWQLYCNWYETFALGLPMAGVLYLTTDVTTSASRILTRGRTGEDQIPVDYLNALETQHRSWISSTTLPVLSLNTETNVEDHVAAIRGFIAQIQRPTL